MANEVAFEQLTKSEHITRVITRIRRPRNKFSNFYGIGIGMPNVQQPGGEQIGWATYNQTRQMARGRARDAVKAL